MEERLKKIEEFIKSFESANSLPRSVSDTLVASGFLKYDKSIFYEAGAGGNAFENMVIKAGKRRKMIYTEPVPISFIVKSISTNTLTKIGGDLDLEMLIGKVVTLGTDGTLPGGLGIGSPISVLSRDGEDFTLTTNGTTPINITSSGTGTHYLISY